MCSNAKFSEFRLLTFFRATEFLIIGLLSLLVYNQLTTIDNKLSYKGLRRYLLHIAIIGISNVALFIYQVRKRSLKEIRAIEPVFLFFIIMFIIGLYSNVSVILINILILFIGVMTVREGAQKDHLGILNYGLFLICVLITCRFFDTDISFVLRGVLFVLIGLGFLLTNYWMVKIKRKNKKGRKTKFFE